MKKALLFKIYSRLIHQLSITYPKLIASREAKKGEKQLAGYNERAAAHGGTRK